MKKILVIDDDVDICTLLKRFLSKKGYEVEVVHTGQSALSLLKKNKYDLALCDFRLPDIDGLEMIPEIKKLAPSIQVVIITGYSDVKMAVNVIKRGAFEYVTKPIHPEEILITIEDAFAKQKSLANNSASESSVPKAAQKKTVKKPDLPKYVKGSGTRSKQIHQLIELVAPTNMTVVILGESGTGKEATAETIHVSSARSQKPFVALDCGAIPAEIASSELFGHKKGSFTGALSDKIGHFEAANGGTLFLDEIGNLSYENQIKLLRVLQERKVKRIGETSEIDVDVRIIVATNEDLKDMVSKGKFREDLYYRINEFRIDLPALRERKSDIKEFADFMLHKSSYDLNKEVTEISAEALAVFQNYFWPGNLREMKNVIKRATLMSTTNTLELDALPTEIKNPEFFESFADNSDEEEMPSDLKSVVEQAEKKAILNVLRKTGFNKSKAAKVLKVDRKTLYNKINAYDIDLPN